MGTAIRLLCGHTMREGSFRGEIIIPTISIHWIFVTSRTSIRNNTNLTSPDRSSPTLNVGLLEQIICRAHSHLVCGRTEVVGLEHWEEAPWHFAHYTDSRRYLENFFVPQTTCRRNSMSYILDPSRTSHGMLFSKWLFHRERQGVLDTYPHLIFKRIGGHFSGHAP